jgi:thioredoxin-dependent peroxiredoxin
MRRTAALCLFAGTLALAPAAAGAQELLAVGEVAPEFALTGATRYGILAEPVRLSDFRGETVVLAFFFRARTPG